jgi:flagellin-like protein
MKGISPIVATIMLIAFALAASGMFFSWFYQFTYSSREELQACSIAQISLQNAYYNPETGNINLVIYNTGSVPLTGFIVLVSSDKTTSAIKDFASKEIKANDIGLFPVKRTEDIRSIVVQSVQCRNAQDMISIYEVKGL